MSTFLDDTNILLQLENRYMIFNSDGVFIGNIDFDFIRVQNNFKRS